MTAHGLRQVLERVEPDEIYNLGAQSHVGASFFKPEYTADANGPACFGCWRRSGTTRCARSPDPLLPGRYERDVRRNASPAERDVAVPPAQSLRRRQGVRVLGDLNYREAYGLYASNGILFNHESERRGETFVTRKITRAVRAYHAGLQDKLYLGNLDAKRDWGHARDYVEAMWLMLQQDKPDDYVIATGETHSVREFVEQVFGRLDLDWERHVEIDPRYFRPSEVEALQGDPTKARSVLGWEPKVGLDELVQLMVDSDLELAKQERVLAEAGHSVPVRGGSGT